MDVFWKVIGGPVARGLGVGVVCLSVAGAVVWSVDQWRSPALAEVLPTAALGRVEQVGPIVGEPAPPLRLPTLAGERTVDLSELRGRRVVLVFGSFSCPLIGGHLERLGLLYEAHRAEAEFLFVNIEEAGHRLPGLEFLVDGGDGAAAGQRERVARAARLLSCPLPILFDTEGTAAAAYEAFPLRLFAVGAGGAIELDLGHGAVDGDPWDLDRLEAWLGGERAGGAVR